MDGSVGGGVKSDNVVSRVNENQTGAGGSQSHLVREKG